MVRDAPDGADELTPRERARLRHRDGKRSTAMVVDNAAVKRTAMALAARRSSRTAPPGTPELPDGGS